MKTIVLSGKISIDRLHDTARVEISVNTGKAPVVHMWRTRPRKVPDDIKKLLTKAVKS